MNYQSTYENVPGGKHSCHSKCISWSAIVIGALVGIGLSFLLNIFSASIGLSLMHTTAEGVRNIAMGGFAGLLIGAFVTMFVQGWVAGYLARRVCRNRYAGLMYGFTAWSLALILTVLLAAPMTRFAVLHFQSVPERGIALIKFSNMVSSTVGELKANQKDDSQNAAAKKMVMTPAEKMAVRNVGRGLFFTFILFFVGALASCFGGYCGLKPCGEAEEKNRENTRL